MKTPEQEGLGKGISDRKEKYISGFLALLSRYRTEIIGLSAIWILVFHEWEPVLTGHHTLLRVQTYIKTIGFCGVDICLFLSAIGLVRSIEKHGTAGYYRRRFRRVYLPFFLMGIVYAVYNDWPFSYFLMCVTGVSFFRISMYCLLWFVPAVLVFYCLFPLYYFFLRKVRRKGLFTLIVILIWFFVETFVFTGRLREDLWGLTNRIPVFLIGVYWGCRQQEGRDTFLTREHWAALLLGFAAVLVLCEQVCVERQFFLVPSSDCFFPTLCLALTIPILQAGLLQVLGRYKGTAWLSKFLSWILRFFGKISLELYCVQEFLGTVMKERFRDGVASWKLNLMIFLASIFAGVLLNGVDNGFWKLGGKVWKRKGAGRGENNA